MTAPFSRTFELGTHVVGGGNTFVIAEVAQAHDGSLGAAHAYIDAVARAGAHAIKFQTHIASAESTADEPWRVKFSQQDASRYDYWKRMEFTREQWRGLKQHADDKGLVFLSSPFSVEAVALLSELGVPAWKIGSGEVTNLPFLDRVAHTQKPVLLSSGMSTWAELDAAVKLIEHHAAPLAVFQCTTSYPCPPHKVGLNVVEQMRARYPGVPIGLSDHSATIFAGLGAVALGAALLEVHVCFSREQFGPDTRSSLTIDELKSLVDGAAFLDLCRASPVDKDVAASEMDELKRIFGKSVVAARALSKGTRLSADMLACKKPGTGIPAARLPELVGKVLLRDVRADEQLEDKVLE